MQLDQPDLATRRRRDEGEGTGRLTVRDVARRTGRSQKTIYRYIRAGKLNAELVTTPHGQLYLIEEQEVAKAGLPLVQTTATSDTPATPEKAHAVGDGPLLRYLQSEIVELKSENRRLRGELDRALYIIGIFRGRLEDLQRRVSAACRRRDDVERKLLQAENDASFYRSRPPDTDGRSWMSRLMGRG